MPAPEKNERRPRFRPTRAWIVPAVEMAIWLAVAAVLGGPFVVLARTSVAIAIVERGSEAALAILVFLLPIFVLLVAGTSPLHALLRRTTREEAGPPEETDDAVLASLLEMRRRSKKLAARALTRSNAHLLLGATVGLIGLLFFYFMTGPDYLPRVEEASWDAVAANLANALPRVFILVFVELMAAFFLKQYRAAMEEFRYYEEVLRHREAAVFAYAAAVRDPRNRAVDALAATLLERTSFGVLKTGETTGPIEATRLSQNEVTTLIAAAAAAAEQVVRRTEKDGEGKAEKKES